MTHNFHVAIIGGGPGGSTLASLLRKYDPSIRVAVFEREQFPREHVGESLLPRACNVMDEVGVWDKIEAADFPIKVGATYKWGKTPELWDFLFTNEEEVAKLPRPGKYEGCRRSTTFQVDRSKFDEILLDHASELGAQIFEQTPVRSIQKDGDFVEALVLENGDRVIAECYVDASGHSGFLRRSMGVGIEYPTSLQNIAVWDYWQNAEWAVRIGVGGTRVQVFSVPFGWVWFIPLGPTRTSIGLVTSAEYYKKSGKKPAELYRQALAIEPLLVDLVKEATCENKLSTTSDWSFLSERMFGENWFLVGESAGFADPILAAGLTITMLGARELAYTILATRRRQHPKAWLCAEYDRRQRAAVLNHVRFAQYWYTANTQFDEMKEFTAVLAKDAGLSLDPEKAWAWLAQGGFIGEDGVVGMGECDLGQMKGITTSFGDQLGASTLDTSNEFELNLNGATLEKRARYAGGQIFDVPTYVRGDRRLPLVERFSFWVSVLQQTNHWPGMLKSIHEATDHLKQDKYRFWGAVRDLVDSLEAMVGDGWVTARLNPDLPLQNVSLPPVGQFRKNVDQVKATGVTTS